MHAHCSRDPLGATLKLRKLRWLTESSPPTNSTSDFHCGGVRQWQIGICRGRVEEENVLFVGFFWLGLFCGPRFLYSAKPSQVKNGGRKM